MNKIIAVELPKAITYGAVELKDWIAKHTLRGVLASFGLTLLLFLFVIISAKLQYQVYFSPITAITSVDIPPPSQTTDDEEDETKPDAATITDRVINHGPASRAGVPVGIPDAEIKVDIEFASTDEIDRASSKGGDGLDDGTFASNIDMNPVKIEEVIEKLPDFDDFLAVEKEPTVSNINDLMKLVEYPEMAKRSGIEGTVTIAVLIDKSGKPVKTKILNSENANLNAAAVKGVMAYRGYTPALQNKQPTSCWLTIPVSFKLSN